MTGDPPLVARKLVRLLRGEVHAVEAAWLRLAATGSGPCRVTFARPIDEPGLPAPVVDAVEVSWWDADAAPDADTLEQRLRSLDAHLAAPAGSVAVVAEEVVGRGADALAARWADGGPRPKMMSIGRRAADLSREAFARRWRREAGTLGGEAIPDEVRGVAYVQDHPIGPDDPPFDAINEVWFDSLDALRARAAWLTSRPIPADLMDPATCATLCLVEEPLTP